VNTDLLLATIFADTDQPLAVQCTRWIRSSRRFRSFVETYRDKIRKKVRQARDAQGLRDLRCELAVAFLLLEARELEVAYELATPGNRGGPDFTVVYKTHTPVQVEVKRLRAPAPGQEHVAAAATKILNALGDKFAQMQSGAINVLVLFVDRAETSDSAAPDLLATMRTVQVRIMAQDDAFFVGRGFGGVRAFIHASQPLSAIVLRTEEPAAAALWRNPAARHRLPAGAATVLQRCLAADDPLP
jgi:hypothetical protein